MEVHGEACAVDLAIGLLPVPAFLFWIAWPALARCGMRDQRGSMRLHFAASLMIRRERFQMSFAGVFRGSARFIRAVRYERAFHLAAPEVDQCDDPDIRSSLLGCLYESLHVALVVRIHLDLLKRVPREQLQQFDQLWEPTHNRTDFVFCESTQRLRADIAR
jgi:hypothetical protein